MATNPVRHFVPTDAVLWPNMTFSGDAVETSQYYQDTEAKVSASLAGSQFMAIDNIFKALEEYLNKLEGLERGWDTYDAEPPSKEAISKATDFLRLLRTTLLTPSKVLPSGEGGVALSFYSDNGRDAYIEFLNGGECEAVLYANSGEFTGHEIDISPEGASCLARLIREHREGSSR